MQDIANVLGRIELKTAFNFQGYNADKRRLLSDVDRLATGLDRSLTNALTPSLGGLGLEISRQMQAGVAEGIRQIDRQVSSRPARSLTNPFNQRQPQYLDQSFGRSPIGTGSGRLSGEYGEGVKSGEKLGDGIAAGLKNSEPRISSTFRSMTAALVAADVIKFGVNQAISGTLGTLPGQITQTLGGVLSGGGGLQQAISLQTEQNTAVSTLASLTGSTIPAASASIEKLNSSLAKSAAALPGQTEDYKSLARVLSDNLIPAFKSADGSFDDAGFVTNLSGLAESYGAITASSTKDTGNTSLALTRALGGASSSQLRQFAFFEQNPVALSQMESRLAEVGAESLADLTVKSRVNLLLEVGETILTPEAKAQAENSVDGLLEALRSSLFDPSEGIFGLRRDLDKEVEGVQSVFDSFNAALKGLVSQNGDDLGLVFRLFDSAQRAGLELGDPLIGRKNALDAIASSIESLKGRTDELFQSGSGQAFIQIVNTVSGAFGSLLAGGEGASVALTGVATLIGGPIAGGLALLATNAERSLPIIASIGGVLSDGFNAALPVLTSARDVLFDLLEKGATLAQGLRDPLSQAFDSVSGALQGAIAPPSMAFVGAGGPSFDLPSFDTFQPQGFELPSFGRGEGEGDRGSSVGGGLGESLSGAGAIASDIGTIAKDIIETLGHGIELVGGLAASFLPVLEIVTNIASSITSGISGGIGRFSQLISDNSGLISDAFGSILSIVDALKPGVIAVGTLMGEVAGQAIVLAANLLTNETVLNGLVGAATLLSNVVKGISDFASENKWIVSIGGMVVDLETITRLTGLLSTAFGAIAPIVGAVKDGLVGVVSLIANGTVLIQDFANGTKILETQWQSVGAAIGLIGSSIDQLAPLVFPVVQVTTSLTKLIKEGIGGALAGTSDLITGIWGWTKNLRDTFGEVRDRIGSGVQKLDAMFGISERLAGPLQKIKDLAGNIKEFFANALKSIQGIPAGLKKAIDMLLGLGRGGGGGDIGQTIKSGLFTAPQSRNGGSAAYHIDTKLSKDLSDEARVQIFDQLAAGYAAMGKEIEFSNNAVSGEIYKVTDSFKKKAKLLRRAAEAHSHSVSANFDSFDYYVPDTGKGRYDKSAEGVEMLLPGIGGASVDYNSGGRYGNYAIVTDANGKVLLKQGHGDDGRSLPANFQMNTTTASQDRMGGGGGGALSLGQGYGSLNQLASQLGSNQYFDPSSSQGRAALALALGIGGTEAFGKDVERTDFFTRMGGTGNMMKGFGQLNQNFANNRAGGANPESYKNYMGAMLTGNTALANGSSNGNIAASLAAEVQKGTIKGGQDLIRFMQSSGLGGSNWQGVDDGWSRVPGLADQLVSFLKGNGGGGGGTQSLPDYQYDTPIQVEAELDDHSHDAIASDISSSISTGADSGVEAAAAEAERREYELRPDRIAAKVLRDAQLRIKQDAERTKQNRDEEDRNRVLERENRNTAINVELSELDPEDTTGAALLNYERTTAQIDEAIGDRVRVEERQIEDLKAAREIKIRQTEELALLEKAFKEEQITGDIQITKEDIEKKKAEISVFDYSREIDSRQSYIGELEKIAAPQLQIERNKLIKLMDAEVKKADELELSTRELAAQYSDPNPYQQYLAQIEKIGVAFDKQKERVEDQIISLDRLIAVEGLSEEQQIALVTQRVELAKTFDLLTAAQDRSTESLKRNRDRQLEDQQTALFDRALQSKTQVVSAQADFIEPYDREKATAMRRQVAQIQLMNNLRKEARDLLRAEEDAVNNLNDAIAAGDTQQLEDLAELGLDTVTGIEGFYDQVRSNAEELYLLSLEGITKQFPTVAEQFRSTIRDSFASGFSNGLNQFRKDGDILGLLGSIGSSMFEAVIGSGIQRLTETATNGLFGDGKENKGFLDELFPSTEDPEMENQAETAKGLLESGGALAGLEMVRAAREANAIMSGASGPSKASVLGISGEKRGGIAELLFPKDKSFEKAGSVIGETFTKIMPKAGEGLGGGFGSILQTVLGSLGGGGGGGGFGSIFQTVLSAFGGGIGADYAAFSRPVGSFSYGGYVPNYAGGGIADALKRERSQSGLNPMLAVVHEGEFQIPAKAAKKITAAAGDGFLESLRMGNIPNYAEGGAIGGKVGGVPNSVSDAYALPGSQFSSDLSSTRSNDNRLSVNMQYQRIGDRDYVERSQVDEMRMALEGQINQKASAAESVGATIDAFRNLPEARRAAGI